jgi:hypothetical protein
VWVLIAIKNAAQTDDTEGQIVEPLIPTDMNGTFTPITFNDYLTGLQAKKICEFNEKKDQFSKSDYLITGVKYHNWHVPLVKCDSRLCKSTGQDAATTVCEYNVIGIGGDTSRVLDFLSWIEIKYPILANRSEDVFPFSHSLFKKFADSQGMDDYVTSASYGSYPSHPKLAMGIIFNSNDPYVYDYTLRQNSTNYNNPEHEGRPATATTPDTDIIQKEYGKNDFDVCLPTDGTPYQGEFGFSCTGQYIYNGILAFERLVNDFIIYDAGNSSDSLYVSEAGVQVVPFPTRPYIDSGFYAALEGMEKLFPLFVIIFILIESHIHSLHFPN